MFRILSVTYLLTRKHERFYISTIYIIRMSFRALNNLRPKKHFLNEQRSKDAAAKKRPNTSGVGKINNYYEDIYIPPYNNTD